MQQILQRKGKLLCATLDRLQFYILQVQTVVFLCVQMFAYIIDEWFGVYNSLCSEKVKQTSSPCNWCCCRQLSCAYSWYTAFYTRSRILCKCCRRMCVIVWIYFIQYHWCISTSLLGGVQSIVISVFVCLSVDLRISEVASILWEVFCTLPFAMARSSSDNNAICCVLRFCGWCLVFTY